MLIPQFFREGNRLREGNDLFKATWPLDGWVDEDALLGLSSPLSLLPSSCVPRGNCDSTGDARETLRPAHRHELSRPVPGSVRQHLGSRATCQLAKGTAVPLAASPIHFSLPWETCWFSDFSTACRDFAIRVGASRFIRLWVTTLIW